MRQAPTKIKNIYYEYYIGNEKEFLELLLYMQENKNTDEVIKAIEQLKDIRPDYVSTDRILFICEQSSSKKSNSKRDDDITEQAENNMMAYEALFNQLEEVTSS